MNLRNKSIMVTGGAGFIGSHLVDELILNNAEKITVVDNFFLGKKRNLKAAESNLPQLRICNQNIGDVDAIKKIMEEDGTDVVFNLAVIPLPCSLEKPEWTFSENCRITQTVAELAREGLFKTLIHFSSSEAYGSSLSGPMDENHPLNATTPYAASKAASDLLVLSYIHTYGIDASIVRPFNNYGPRQNEGAYAGIIPITIKRILEGESPHIYGDGKQTRDYLFVTDTAKAAITVLGCKKTRGLILNIASGREVSINHLVNIIVELMDWKGGIVYEPDRPADVRRHIANIYLAEDLIDFKQTVSFEEGMKLTVDWYQQNMLF